MLVAVTAAGHRHVASAAARGSGARCPDCAETLIVRLPATRVPHFAHPAGRRCEPAAARSRRAAVRRAAMKEARRAAEDPGQEQGALFPFAVDPVA
jgi:hypothetical protein